MKAVATFILIISIGIVIVMIYFNYNFYFVIPVICYLLAINWFTITGVNRENRR